MKRKLLLHICCAPCSTSVIKKLRSEGFEVNGLFYNPNIHPEEEFTKRLETVKDYSAGQGLNITIDNEYDIDLFKREVEAKGGDRCFHCYKLRLGRTAYCAKENGFDSFSTTISISPYQKLDLIKKAGEEASKMHKIPFYFWDFTPLYKESIDLSKKAGLYRQKYCGCYLSMKEANHEKD